MLSAENYWTICVGYINKISEIRAGDSSLHLCMLSVQNQGKENTIIVQLYSVHGKKFL